MALQVAEHKACFWPPGQLQLPLAQRTAMFPVSTIVRNLVTLARRRARANEGFWLPIGVKPGWFSRVEAQMNADLAAFAARETRERESAPACLEVEVRRASPCPARLQVEVKRAKRSGRGAAPGRLEVEVRRFSPCPARLEVAVKRA